MNVRKEIMLDLAPATGMRGIFSPKTTENTAQNMRDSLALANHRRLQDTNKIGDGGPSPELPAIRPVPVFPEVRPNLGEIILLL